MQGNIFFSFDYFKLMFNIFLMDSVLTKISFVTGKGGVGKSSIAAGLALHHAFKGKKTLLVEIGLNSAYENFLNVKEIGYKPQQFPPIWIAKWNVETCLKEYILSYLKIEKLYKVFFENQIMKVLIDVAPALSDLAILGKITSDIVGFENVMGYEEIVIDSYATGHMLTMLRSPRGLSEVITSGPMGDRSKKIDQVLKSSHCDYYITTLPESLPSIESIELGEVLKSEFGIKPKLIINQVLDNPFTEKEFSDLKNKRGEEKEFINHLQFVFENQKKYIEELTQKFEDIKMIPKYFTFDHLEIFKKMAQLL